MKRILVYGIAAILLLIAAFVSTLIPNNLSEPELPVFDTLGGDFVLPSTRGGEFDLLEARGEVVLLNFGFTSCPDVCPTALARMRDVIETVEAQGGKVKPVFITVDPERDSLDKLTDYLAFFHPTLIGLGGTLEQVQAVSDQYKVFFEKQKKDSELGYSVVHSDQIYLLDSHGRIRATFANHVQPEEMATQVMRLQPN